jgi:hypothetical protein
MIEECIFMIATILRSRELPLWCFVPVSKRLTPAVLRYVVPELVVYHHYRLVGSKLKL